MKLKALRALRYASKSVLKGAVFEANKADVRVLVGAKIAEHYVEPQRVAAVFKPIPPVVAAEAIVAAQVAEFADTATAHEALAEDKPKRAYKRRDMTAES